MTIYSKISFASRAAALALLVFAVGCDRDEKPASAPVPAQSASRPADRMSDPEYREQLKGHIDSQRMVAGEINDIERRMDLQRRRARAALGAGATDAQVLAELESNPVKYPEWKHLVGRRNAAEKSMKDRRAEARATVLARIAREKQAAESAAAPAKSGN